ncbi:hypothetical protein [Nonomuraea fuscirosea]|uniref:hypothetical protein n=1 Tax=Nonomuraea fuscirosea TaxID=1291556 RepID=UPI00343E287F
MRTLPATATVLAAAMVLTGCGGDQNGSGTGGSGQAGPGSPGSGSVIILPEEDLVSDEDSGDLPEATAHVALDCQEMSKTHDFAGTARRMSAAASSRDSSPSAKALAKVCLAAAKANQGLLPDALDEAEEAEKQLRRRAFTEEVPASTAREAQRFLYRVMMYSASATGDVERAKEARAELERLGGVSPQDLKNTCSVASDPAVLPDCATIGPSSSATEPPPDERPTTSGESSPDEQATEPGEPAGSGTGTTDGPAETGGPVETGGPAGPTDEGDSPPDDSTPDDGGPAPAES